MAESGQATAKNLKEQTKKRATLLNVPLEVRELRRGGPPRHIDHHPRLFPLSAGSKDTGLSRSTRLLLLCWQGKSKVVGEDGPDNLY